MRYGEDGAPKLGNILLQPHGSLKVQVVGGLIQQEDIRILQDQAAQVHPGLFAAGKLREKPAAHGVIDGEAICHLADGGIGVPASQSLEPGREVAVAL